MAGFDSVLGIMAGSGGGIIPQLPVNPTPDQLRNVLSEIIAKLNNFSRDIVVSKEVTIDITGVAIETTSFAHNLGYKPRILAQLDGRSLTLNLVGGVAPDANLPLPTGLSYSIGVGAVTIKVWLEAFTDTTNVYFRCLNGDGSTYSGLPIKYSLSRDPAN